jgi:hypothetical protein
MWVQPWRRFQSLEVYADDGARKIYLESVRRHERGIAAMSLFASVAAAVVGGVSLVVLGFVSAMFYGVVDDLRSDLWRLLVVFAVVPPPFIGVLTYSALRVGYIEDCIEDELKPKRADLSRCSVCGYDLAGLPEIDAAIKCPECAHETSTAWYSVLDDLEIERAESKP